MYKIFENIEAILSIMYSFQEVCIFHLCAFQRTEEEIVMTELVQGRLQQQFSKWAMQTLGAHEVLSRAQEAQRFFVIKCHGEITLRKTDNKKEKPETNLRQIRRAHD